MISLYECEGYTLQPDLISRAHGTQCLFEAFWAGHPPQWTQMACPQPTLLSPWALLLPPSLLVSSQTACLACGYILGTCDVLPSACLCSCTFPADCFPQFPIASYHRLVSITADFSSLTPSPFSDPQESSLLAFYWTGTITLLCSGPAASVNCCYCSMTG